MTHKFYFSPFEKVKPPQATPHNRRLEYWWQICATATISLGIWYLYWRWTSSLNFEAIFFSASIATAETLAFIGLILFFHNIWSISDTPQQRPPVNRSDCLPAHEAGPITVDIFITTYTEDPEIVRLSIKSAKAVKIPKNTRAQVSVLDDGNRVAMKSICLQENVGYLTRNSNLGFKAGNLKNALDNTFGDFIVICDADTRLFETFLTKTLGYFRDVNVAWVQTPQWFFDIPPGVGLADYLGQKTGRLGHNIGKLIEVIFGPVKVGRDPFSSDSGLFFDIIQRRRNGQNASFCCGAGSVHRREALIEVALRNFGGDAILKSSTNLITLLSKSDLPREVYKCEIAQTVKFTPYKFHVSEDLYTSIFIHADSRRKWKSVFHPDIECKMLSPWSLESWAIQNFKYAGGTLDILANDSTIFSSTLSIRQKLHYGATFWSYLSPIWIVLLLCAPIVTMATGLAPVDSYSADFYLHLIPFLLFNELATVLGTWGHDAQRGKRLSISSFAIVLQALTAVLRKKKIKFPVTPKGLEAGNSLYLVQFHITIIALTVCAFTIAAHKNFFEPDPSALAALIVNGFWGLNNIYSLWLLISAAQWSPPSSAELADQARTWK